MKFGIRSAALNMRLFLITVFIAMIAWMSTFQYASDYSHIDQNSQLAIAEAQELFEDTDSPLQIDVPAILPAQIIINFNDSVIASNFPANYSYHRFNDLYQLHPRSPPTARLA